MALQQRIVGGGLLMAGIAVVLILIFLFSNKGMPFDEAYGELRNKIFPAYEKADEDGDYLKLQALAKEVSSIKSKAPMTAVLKEVRADAARGDRTAIGLQKLLEPRGTDGKDAFDKNLEGLYELDGGWYEARSHTALRLLKRCLDDAMPALTETRRMGKALATTLDSLRTGSGLEIALPAVDAPTSPVAAADARLFAAFGLRPDDIRTALTTKGAGSPANSARLVWNKPDASDDRKRLAEAMAKIPTLASTIERSAVALGKAQQDLQGKEDATKEAGTLIKAAGQQLATSLDGQARTAFEQGLGVPAIAETLMQEAKLLKRYATNAPDVGKALQGSFAQ
jgi:hypothetical protein